MKAYTDILQSKKLAKILPHNTADGTWKRVAIAGCNLDVPEEQQYLHDGDTQFVFYSGIGIPSWSLAALLDVIPIEHVIHCYLTENGKVYRMETLYAGNSKTYDNPVDACVDLILKLYEQKIL